MRSITVKIKLEKVDHICVIVENIEKTLDQVKQTFVVPPIKIEEYTSTAKLKGKEIGKYKLKLAMVNIANNLVLEFLEIVEGRSIEQKWLQEHGSSLHHIALKVDNMEERSAQWEQQGLPIMQEDHGKWIYFDTEKILGFNIELVPTS